MLRGVSVPIGISTGSESSVAGTVAGGRRGNGISGQGRNSVGFFLYPGGRHVPDCRCDGNSSRYRFDNIRLRLCRLFLLFRFEVLPTKEKPDRRVATSRASGRRA